MEIAVSYSRKLNHALYGGNNFESSDFFCSLKLELEDETDPKGVHDDLSKNCKEMVDQAVEREILEINGGLPKVEWDSWLTTVINGKGWGTSTQYERMSAYQRNIAQMLKRAASRAKYKNAKEDDKTK